MSCGACSECCRQLEVAEIGKPWNMACPHQRFGRDGCCAIYEKRPAACGSFRCLWLASQDRSNVHEHLPVGLRPDKTRVVFYRAGNELDDRAIFAHVDPAYPHAWEREPVAGEIRRLVGRGAIVIVVIGETRISLRAGAPPEWANEAQLKERRANLARRALPGLSSSG